MRIKIESNGNPARTYLYDAVSGEKLRLVQEVDLKIGLESSVLKFTQNGYESPALVGRRIDGEWIFETE